MSDQLFKFDFPAHPIRGGLVSLDATWKAVLETHDYPSRVREALGEALAACLLLASSLKMKGAVSMQVRGNGPIEMLVVQATTELTVRGMAQWDAARIDGDEPLFGDGNLVVMLEPENSAERYQGVTEVTSGSLAKAIEGYFERSEQLPTRLWLATSGERVAGLLLQQMPGEAEDPDAWNRFGIFGDSLSAEEIRDLEATQLLHRLFHEEDVRLYNPVPVAFRCRCSTAVMRNMLKALGRAEVESILEEQGKIEITCEFCNRCYLMDAVDVAELFKTDPAPPHSSATH